MNRNLYARKKRQFRRLTEEVNQLQASGQWDSMDGGLRGRLIRRIKNLYDTIYGYFTRREWKKAVAMAGFVLMGTAAVNAQTFLAPQTNPFGLSIPAQEEFLITNFVDMDQDGDLDLIGSTYYNGSAIYFQNTGSASNPQFGAPQIAPFGLTSQYTFYTAAADLDADGDIDVLGSAYVGYSPQFSYFQNNGTAQSPSFGSVQINPFGLNGAAMNVLALGEFGDLDNDGDYDYLASDYYGSMFYFQNTGTAQSPAFAAPVQNPFGIVTSTNELGRVNMGDIDLDGDLDLITGGYNGNFYYFENTGTATSPAFGPRQTNPFGLSSSGNYSFAALGDLDADGDLDILSSVTDNSYVGTFSYYQNTDPTIGIEEQAVEVSIYPSPFTSQVTVDLENSTEGSITVLDVTGKRMHQSEFKGVDQVELNLSGLPAGMYLMQILTPEGVATKRITKQ